MIKSDITLTKICENCGQSFNIGIHANRRRYCDSCSPEMKLLEDRAKTKTWRNSNRQDYNQYMRSYRQSHPEISQSLVESRRIRRDTDPEYANLVKQKAKDRLHTPEYRQVIRNSRHKRRSHFKQDGKWGITLGEWSIILDAFGNQCVYCGSKEELHQDHFIPLSKGGKTEIGNIVPACKSCNSHKHDKMPQDFASNYYDIVKVLDSLSPSLTH